MKIIVDDTLCEGNGVCESIAPELFHLDDAGQLHIEAGALAPDLRARADKAVQRCPKGALRLVDSTGEDPRQPLERSSP